MKQATTRGEAQQQAIDWQREFSERSMSWGELAEETAYFEEVGKEFNLTEEFRENGII